MRFASFLILLACTANDPAALPDDALATPPAEFAMSAGAFIAGAQATFTFAGAPPNATIRMAYSTNGLGAGNCPPALGGECLDIRGAIGVLPVQVLANGAGTGSITLTLPPQLAGVYLSTQAVVLGAPAKVSNPVARLVGAVGTVINQNVDGDGDGQNAANGDCNDADRTTFRGAADQVGDGRDQSCDNVDGVDADGDGFASQQTGGRDCTDTVPTTYPGAVDVCNGFDDDCNLLVDDGPWGGSCNRSEQFQAGNSAVDLLFVIDDSGSMAEEQARLAAISGSFLDTLVAAGLDFHLGVVTTDMDSNVRAGRLVSRLGQRWIAPQAGGTYAQWFEAAIQVGINGSADEQGLAASAAAVIPPLSTGYNAGFLRNDSDLHVVFLSDEQDYSLTSTTDWVTGLSATRGPGHVLQAHGIIGPTGGCPTADAGTRYADVISATYGVEADICGADYDPAVSRIADTIIATSGGGQTFTLAGPADPATIEVEANVPGMGIVVLAPGQYTWDPATQTLEITGLVLPSGTTVTIRYDV